jgi:class 3 adenylate cyclase
MTFEEVLDQAMAMLQRRGRLTYRTLKLHFQLDDEHLDALKDELIYGQRLAVDEDGRVLVWTANTEATGAPAGEQHDASSSPPLALTRQPAMRAAPPPRHTTTAAPHMPNAERRYLTVMFCDLVDSTMLSRQLDPEDLRAIVHAYQTTCAEVIQRFAGHIAQYLGDGLLVYFGYPQAHEDDAQRAVRAGLGIIEAMGTLNTQLQQEHRIQLAVRVGIHSGLVVVGEMGGGERHERLALGETPNIAARLQSLAQPGSVVISERIQRLVGGGFDYENLDAHELKGLAEPMQVYQVHGERGSESRFEAATATGLTPLVGREEEIGLLLRRWEQAQEGEGQVVLLTGEAGIGKSRILQTLRERLADEPHILLRGQCLPYYTNSAFYPIIAHLERAMPCAGDAPPSVKLDALEALLAQARVPVGDVAPLFAALLSIPSSDRYPPLTLSPQRQKDKTIEALIDQVRGLSQQQPVLFLFEDVHWIDPTSLEVLDRLVDRVQDVRVLLVITYRPEFASPWGGCTYVTSHTLNRLSRRQVATMVAQMTGGKALPQQVLDQIVAKTDGVPLFVEELTKTVLESGLLTDDGERYTLTAPLPQLAIPDTLQG